MGRKVAFGPNSIRSMTVVHGAPRFQGRFKITATGEDKSWRLINTVPCIVMISKYSWDGNRTSSELKRMDRDNTELVLTQTTINDMRSSNYRMEVELVKPRLIAPVKAQDIALAQPAPRAGNYSIRDVQNNSGHSFQSSGSGSTGIMTITVNQYAHPLDITFMYPAKLEIMWRDKTSTGGWTQVRKDTVQVMAGQRYQVGQSMINDLKAKPTILTINQISPRGPRYVIGV